MNIKSFTQQGYTVQVDVPVIVKREFFVELFVNNVFDSAEERGLKESQLESYIKSI